jgi:sulfhydrogenase subunit beta (sulfur reductase)
MQNTRLSPKSLVFPQSETMLDFSLDQNDADQGICKEVPKDYSPRAILGMRPCDAKAMGLVHLNFDNGDYQDPYWLNLFNASTFVGLACDAPCGTCFCTTAGCGPYHEEELDLLLSDRGDHYLAKVITDKGQALADKAGWSTSAAEEAMEEGKAAAEAKNHCHHRNRPAPEPGHPCAARCRYLGRHLLFLHQLRHLYLRVSHLLVF